jgi:hypothetical protein
MPLVPEGPRAIENGAKMTKKLLIATAAAVALMAGGALAQTINNAPQNSPAGVANETKEAPQTGDSSQVGGTPSANEKGKQSQMQDSRARAQTGSKMAPAAKDTNATRNN